MGRVDLTFTSPHFSSPNLSPFVAGMSEWVDRRMKTASVKDVSLPVQTQVAEFIPDAASILWYPEVFHTELAVGDKVYQTFCGYQHKWQISQSLDTVKRGGSGFVRFGVTLTKEELARLNGFLDKKMGQSNDHTCVSGTSEAFRANTEFNIPVPFNLHPTLNGLYLSALYFAGSSRVNHVEHHGKLRPCVIDGVSLAAAAVFSAAVCGGIIWCL